MKRIAWLLIAVFCSATLRVQPFEKETCTQCVSCHCKVPGDCGVPCNRTTSQASSVSMVELGVAVSALAVRNVAFGRHASVKFYAPYVEPLIHSVVLSAPAPTRAADGPLYMAHCSFLI